MKRNKRIISCIAAAALTLGTFSNFVIAEGAVSISTAADFKSFTERCVYDDYSKNKKFVLQNDIDLGGMEITPAEVFCGTFEGSGHTIKNVVLSVKGSNKGLFSMTTRDAQIRDLNVSGEIRAATDVGAESAVRKKASSILGKSDINISETEGGVKAVGGIVGYNEGKIINCSFSGSVKGEAQVGGVAGFNAMNGLIDTCANSARITGDNVCGGVAGYNEGRIKLSKNGGMICPEATEDTTDAGGICGNNEGALVICTNNGAVGGDSFGDNVGGICGRQSGEIRECINNGAVKGRRSIGGICGRFEPYTDIELSYESAKAALEKQADIFKNDVETAREKVLGYAEDLLGGSGGLSSILSALGITDAAQHHRNNFDILTDAASGMMNSVTDSVNSAQSKDLSGSLRDTLEQARKSLEDGSDALSDMSDDMKQSFDDLNGSIDTTLESVDSFLSEFDGKGKEISDLIDRLNTSLEEGSDDIDEITDSLTRTLTSLRRDIGNITDNLDDTHDYIRILLTDLINAGKKFDKVLTPALEKLDSVVTGMSDALKKLQDSAGALLEIIKGLTGKFPRPTDAPVPDFPTSETETQSGYEAAEDVQTEGGYDVEAVVGAVRNMLFTTAYAAEKEEKKTAISDLRSTDITILRLIGGENADTALIRYCVNNGAVEAAEAGGGIAGSTGFESAVRSGESITLPDGTKVNSDSVLKAVIDSCISVGNITVKDKYAGGVCGKSDIGNIKNSLTTGEIRSENDGCVGGTAGYSGGDIDTCIAINDVYGKDNIGGIAGNGKNIKNSYALPRLDGKADKSGAVAGFATGTVEHCYFIDEGLSGIDGASLTGKAEAVSHDKMISSDGKMPSGLSGLYTGSYYMAQDDIYLPQIKTLAQNNAENIGAILQSKSSELSRFHFKVSFMDRDKELKTMTVEYGSTLSERDIPVLSAQGDEVPVWDKDVKAPIIRHTTFNAVYNKAMSTISTSEEPPLLLVEGIFDDNTEVKLTSESTDREFDGYKKGEVYSFTLTKEAYGNIKVHIRNEKKKASAAAVFREGSWTVEDCVTDGSYAVFEAAGPCEFVLLYKKYSPLPWIALAVVLIVASAGAYITIRKRRRLGYGKTEKDI